MVSLDFSLINPVELPVIVGDKKYILREASGDAACKYRNNLLKSTKMSPDGKVQSVEGLADIEPFLVSLCLFEVTEKGDKPVALHTIRSWPNRVQKALFEEAKRISYLDDIETVESLNKQIDELTKRRDALAVSKEDPSKNF